MAKRRFDFCSTAWLKGYAVSLFVASSGYTLIGEELFPAAACLSGGRMQLGSIVGQDMAKVIVAVLIISGVATRSFGSSIFGELPSK